MLDAKWPVSLDRVVNAGHFHLREFDESYAIRKGKCDAGEAGLESWRAGFGFLVE